MGSLLQSRPPYSEMQLEAWFHEGGMQRRVRGGRCSEVRGLLLVARSPLRAVELRNLLRYAGGTTVVLNAVTTSELRLCKPILNITSRWLFVN